MIMGHVVCRRSGEVFISRHAPKGTIKVMKGDGRRIRWILPKTLPCPIGADDLQFMVAVKAFEQSLLKALADRPRRSRKGYLV